MADKPKTILERVQNLESNVQSIAQAFNQVDEQRQTLGEVIEVLQTALTELGDDFAGKVQKRIEERREEQRKARDARAAEAVSKMVADGTLTVVDAVAQDSFLVGRILAADGSVVSAQAQGVLGTFPPTMREQLVGKTVGEFVTDADGSKFELLELYKFDSPKALTEPEVTADQPTA